MSTSWLTVANIARWALVLGILTHLVAFARAANGQETIPDSNRAGVWYAGRYFGFDPQRMTGLVDEQQATDLAADDWFEPADKPQFGWRHSMHDDRLCLAGTGVYARAEFLWWWMKGMSVPVLATTDPDAGVLPDATVVFGGQRINDQGQPGGRFTIGKWLDSCQCNGVEVSYVLLGQASDAFRGSSDNFELLARPFTNVDPADLGADARLIVDGTALDGTLAIDTTSNFMLFDFIWRRNIRRTDCGNVDLLIGFRHAELRDDVRIADSVIIDTDTINSFDQFHTRNEFNGFVLGLQLQRQLNVCWSWDLLLQGAIGQTHSALGIAGETVTIPETGTSTRLDGGLLTQATNLGGYSDNDFTAIGQFGLNLRRQLDCGWSVNVGYTLLLWGDVLRAGEQIDTYINTSQIPPGTLDGDPRPHAPQGANHFWVQGLQLGLERSF